MKKYKVWTHIDTGVEQIIEAEDGDEAIEIAESNIELKGGFTEQIINNMQVGESNIVE